MSSGPSDKWYACAGRAVRTWNSDSYTWTTFKGLQHLSKCPHASADDNVGIKCEHSYKTLSALRIRSHILLFEIFYLFVYIFKCSCNPTVSGEQSMEASAVPFPLVFKSFCVLKRDFTIACRKLTNNIFHYLFYAIMYRSRSEAIELVTSFKWIVSRTWIPTLRNNSERLRFSWVIVHGRPAF